MKLLGSIVAWFSASIAGIAILVGVFGFIIQRAHRNLLGLDTLPLENDVFFYVDDGGRFLVTLALAFLLIFFAYIAVSISLSAIKQFLSYFTMIERIANVVVVRKFVVMQVIYLLFIFFFTSIAVQQIRFATAPHNLLFDSQLILGDDYCAIFLGDAQERLSQYWILCVSVGISLLACWFFWKRGSRAETGATKQSLILLRVLPLVSVATMSAIGLPAVYGVWMIGSSFPRVSKDNAQGSCRGSNAVLIHQSRERYYIWSPEYLELEYLPASTVSIKTCEQKNVLLDFCRPKTGGITMPEEILR